MQPPPPSPRSALLVIDAQESFRARATDWAGVSDPDIATRIAPLVDRARRRGDLVVWILHVQPDSGSVFDPDSGLVRLLDGLDPASGEPTVRKTSHNAFTSTDLGALLVREHITDVEITGIRTEQCCETTARIASDLGYRVRFVLDATATMPLPRWDGVGVLSAEEVVARTASALQHRFADVMTSEQLLEMP